MVKASRGLRTGTRRKFAKKYKSKFTITPYIREFKVDERVTINPNPSSQQNMPHFRFKGATGVVVGKRGRAYLVKVKMGGKYKTIVAKSEHLLPVPV